MGLLKKVINGAASEGVNVYRNKAEEMRSMRLATFNNDLAVERQEGSQAFQVKQTADSQDFQRESAATGLENAKELLDHKDGMTETFAPMEKNKSTGLIGQYSDDGKFHERGSARRGGTVAANIQELQYLTRPKENGGMGLSQDDAMKRVYNKAGKTIEERADAYARDVIKSSMTSDAEEAGKIFTEAVKFYKESYGENKKSKGVGGNIQRVLDANPGWDAAQAEAYLKHIGKN